jgi:hypothetical protein
MATIMWQSVFMVPAVQAARLVADPRNTRYDYLSSDCCLLLLYLILARSTNILGEVVFKDMYDAGIQRPLVRSLKLNFASDSLRLANVIPFRYKLWIQAFKSISRWHNGYCLDDVTEISLQSWQPLTPEWKIHVVGIKNWKDTRGSKMLF